MNRAGAHAHGVGKKLDFVGQPFGRRLIIGPPGARLLLDRRPEEMALLEQDLVFQEISPLVPGAALENHHRHARLAQLLGSHQAGGAGADDTNIYRVGSRHVYLPRFFSGSKSSGMFSSYQPNGGRYPSGLEGPGKPIIFQLTRSRLPPWRGSP